MQQRSRIAPTPNPDASQFLKLLTRHKPRVDRRLTQLLSAAQKRHGRHGQEVAEMLAAASDLTLRGGKRLRAGLVLVGEQVASGGSVTPTTCATRVGAAMELLQSYFLIHDDWMDQDLTRRGGPAVHAALGGRLGSEHRGACGAILAGDYLVALSTLELSQAVAEHRRATEILERFAELQLAAVVGQQLDVVAETPSAERVYELKTGSYTVCGPLLVGAHLGLGSPELLRALRTFAGPIGVAFQLQDDLISLLGEPDKTGKPFANDLRAGKWTWTIQAALGSDKSSGLAQAAARRAILAVYGQKKSSTRRLQAAVAAMTQCGAIDATRKRIVHLRRKAEQALRVPAVSEPARLLLLSAASALIDRDH